MWITPFLIQISRQIDRATTSHDDHDSPGVFIVLERGRSVWESRCAHIFVFRFPFGALPHKGIASRGGVSSISCSSLLPRSDCATASFPQSYCSSALCNFLQYFCLQGHGAAPSVPARNAKRQKRQARSMHAAEGKGDTITLSRGAKLCGFPPFPPALAVALHSAGVK